MKLKKARVQYYRSIKDTKEFDIEELKTILVGPNEAGKTVLLQALQQLNRPESIPGFDVIRDYPRSLYNDITTGKVDPKDTEIVRGFFFIEEEDKELIPDEFHESIYVRYQNLNNKTSHYLEDAPNRIKFNDINKDLNRFLAHIDKQVKKEQENEDDIDLPSQKCKTITDKLWDSKILSKDDCTNLKTFLESNYSNIDENNSKEEERYNKLIEQIDFNSIYDEVLNTLYKRTPIFVLFNNYFKVKPSIHLEHLAERVERNLLDDDFYDYGNLCLLKLLGFTARELADIGNIESPESDDNEGLKEYKDTLDKRSYQLNAASIRLTDEINNIWHPDPNRPEADRLRIIADGQYLKVVVEDEIGVEIELD